MTELKPCPFCGSKDVEVETQSLYTIYVRCNKCYATSHPEPIELWAIKAWNRRVE